MEGPRQIDRYRLLEEIGSGGMAVVYKGLDTALDREVAVKIMHPHLANKAESRRRFSREARAVARLRHPYILEIYDFSGDEAGESFIVTEYVRGRTLRAFGDEVGFPLPEIAAMAIDQLAEALQAAHEAGIVHRDLKPENVMVRDDGLLKLMDFGIARIIEKDEKMTMTGALVGSPMHMAPEVIEGKEADARADIFALGTIFHWMVTGEMAFMGGSTHDTLRRILEGEYTDARMVKAECSDEIAEIIGRCLRREPAERFQNVIELREALRPILAEAGLENVEHELKAFFAAPPDYAAQLRPRLVERLLVVGEEAITAKRSARALSLFNRILALDPDNARVAEHLARMNRAKRRMRLLKQAGRVVLGIVAALGLAAAVKAGVDAWPVLKPPPQPAKDFVPLAVQPSLELPKPPAPVEPAAEKPEPSTEHEHRLNRDQKRATIVATLPPPPAAVAPKLRHIYAHWTPESATLQVDGKRVSTRGPVWQDDRPVGSFVNLQLSSDCCITQTLHVPVSEGERPMDLGIQLEPANAFIKIFTDKPGAMVYVDGSPRGTVASNGPNGIAVGFTAADVTDHKLSNRKVRLALRPPYDQPNLFSEYSQEVEVTAGSTTRVDAHLGGAP